MASDEQFEIPNAHGTPLNTFVVNHLDKECGAFEDAYKRAVAVKARDEDMHARKKRYDVCLRETLRTMNDRCQRQVMNFQRAVASTDADPAVRREQYEEAAGRLAYCARFPYKPEGSEAEIKPISYYFKNKSEQ